MAVEIADHYKERFAETWEEARYLARLEHELLVGQEIVVRDLYSSEGHDKRGCFVVRLLPADYWDIEGSGCYDCLDPNWDIEPVCEESKVIFAAANSNHECIYIGGPSYRVLEKEVK